MTIQEIRKRSLEYAKGVHSKPKKQSQSKKSRHPMAEYGRRNSLLKVLGFASYADYLASDLWAEIRAKKLAASPKCFGCLGRARQVHHGKYTKSNLLGTSDLHLYSVCGHCHFSCEFKLDKKLAPKQATRRLRRFRRISKIAAADHYALDREWAERVSREE